MALTATPASMAPIMSHMAIPRVPVIMVVLSCLCGPRLHACHSYPSGDLKLITALNNRPNDAHVKSTVR
jgi:hypothetical protein